MKYYKMNSSDLKNSIISFILIVSTVSMPLSFIPKKANAQSVTGYVSGLAPAIVALPQCKEVIGSGIRSLFGGIGSLINDESISDLGSSSSDLSYPTSNYSKNPVPLLENAASSAGSELDSIKVNISDTAEGKAILDTNQKIDSVQKNTEALNANSTCIQSIGRLIIKTLLQKLTISTVAWINSGFDGSPSFIQDPGKFFNDIAKNEILQFGLEINNPELFPFGKAWMRSTAAAFNKKFQDNAQYSLNKLIQETTPEYSAQTFYERFDQGGWSAWTALTQVPANNPLGFKLLADNEIQYRLEGTTESTAQGIHEVLQQANGFLGDQRCVDPMGLTRAENDAALVAGKLDDTCRKWEYVTPGKLISEAATTAINYQNNAYLNAEDLNDAVAAILDALLAQFSSNIMEKGFANVGDEGSSGAFVYDTSNGYNNNFRTQTQKDFMPNQLANSWLSANPNFDIRKDLTQALIDEQRTYSDKLALQNKELLSTTDGLEYKIGSNGISNAYGLLPAIYQLDYCIPGPHPGWENDSRRTLAAALNQVLPETKQSLEDSTGSAIQGIVKSLMPAIGSAIGLSLVTGTGASAVIFGATLGSFAPVIGTIVGALIGLLGSLLGGLFGGSDPLLNVKMYYSSVFASLTGFLPNYGDEGNSLELNISSKSGLVQVMNTVLSRYTTIMKKTYFASKDMLPTVAKEASVIYNQATGYNQMMKNNEDKIAQLKTTVELLGEIKSKVDALNSANPPPDDYEDQLKVQINAFGRVSASMVNGDDIASADNLLKQIKDKKEYIYKNLIKGPYGCEKSLEAPQINFPSAGAGAIIDWSNFNVNSSRRMTYPFPIIYDYNSFAPGADIPLDPWNLGVTTQNKIPNDVSRTLGPGFLTFVFFGGHPTNDGGIYARPERLQLYDLVPTGTEVTQYNWRSLGNTSDPAPILSGPFESIIGIY